MAEPYYCTEDQLRDELGVNASTLTNDAAVALIETAEDITDALLGSWPTDEESGRKVVEADVEEWQWKKLGRFVVKLAALMYRQPKLLEGRRWETESGPDFSVSGPIGGVLPPYLLGVLDATNLRRLAGRARPGMSSRNAELAHKFFTTGQPRP